MSAFNVSVEHLFRNARLQSIGLVEVAVLNSKHTHFVLIVLSSFRIFYSHGESVTNPKIRHVVYCDVWLDSITLPIGQKMLLGARSNPVVLLLPWSAKCPSTAFLVRLLFH